MKRIKVLLATPYGGRVGGISRWAQHIVNYYKKCGYRDCEMDILSVSDTKNIHINTLLKRVYYGVKIYYDFFIRGKVMMQEKKYDIFHLVSSASISLSKDFIMLRLAKKNRIKGILHFHFGRIPELAIKNNWEWKMICKVVKLSTTTIVIDKASFNTLQKAGFDNVVFLPNPVSPQIAEIINQNQGIERKGRTLLFAGHGLKTKGIYELIDACKQISGIKLRMLGKIQDNVKSDLYKKTGNAEWLEVCGEQSFDMVIKEMLSCDVFVLPTYTEGFPNVILESMACGCAIVTTPVGAIPEMLEEENGKHYGILVSPKNVEELKNGIETMLNNEILKEECRNNVQKRVIERYNMNAVWSMLVKIWENVK